MSIRIEASISICIIALLIVGCQKQEVEKNFAHADSLDASAEKYYDNGEYRRALRLYNQGLRYLEVNSKKDSIQKASLLLGVAYSRYYLGMRDRPRLWLDALRYAEADEDAFDVVQTIRAVASLHARQHNYSLEIKSLSRADSISRARPVPDSIRSEIEADLKRAIYDCWQVEYCKIPGQGASATGSHNLATWIAAIIVFALLFGVVHWKIRSP